MSNINAPSNNVSVFPFGSKRTSKHHLYDRVLNEHNITTLIKALTSNPNYVVKYENNVIEFVIQGYYFTLNLDGFESRTLPLYAYINLQDNGTPYKYLSGGDSSDGTFTGITFTEVEVKTEYSLCLLDKYGKVPEESYVRFSSDTLNIDADAISDTINSLKDELQGSINDLSTRVETVEKNAITQANIDATLASKVPPIIKTELDKIDRIYCGTSTYLIN